MKITIRDPGGTILATFRTEAIGECSVRIELDDPAEIRAGVEGLVQVREVAGKLLYSAQHAFPDEERVHALWDGKPLCKMPGVPGSWPAGHRWIDLADPASHDKVTCDSCKQRLGDLYPRLREMVGRGPGR